jgi:hypothetical protein
MSNGSHLIEPTMAYPGGQYVNHNASPPPFLNPPVNQPSSPTNLPAPLSVSSPPPALADQLTGPAVPNATAAAAHIRQHISATATSSDAGYVDASNSVFNTAGRDFIINHYPSHGRTSFFIIHVMS